MFTYLDDAETILQNQLAHYILHMRDAHSRMDADAFRWYLNWIGVDLMAAQDFLAADGTVDGITERMWEYFESPLKPQLERVA